MGEKIFYYLAIMICIYHIASASSICPMGMKMISFSNPTISSRQNSAYYFNGEKIFTTHLKINLEIEVKESVQTSLILSNSGPKLGLNIQNALIVNIIPFKENKTKVFIKVQKKYQENDEFSDGKERIIKIDLPNQEKLKDSKQYLTKGKESQSISIKLEVLIEKNEMKIIYSKFIIFSELIDFDKLLGNYSYIHLESTGDSEINTIKDFTVCYSKSQNLLRNLEENSDSSLEYIEIDDYSIQTLPNILREGNVYIIPSVLLIPKDINGNFPSDILNLSSKQLDNLFNLTHSKNGTFNFKVYIVSKKKLVIKLETKIPGEIYINSKYFKDDVTYVIKINNTQVNIDETSVEINEHYFLYGNNSEIKIFPRDKYQIPMSFIEESEIEKFKVAITLDNKTIINVAKGQFVPDEKAIIFDLFLNFTGEALIEAKYEDKSISCENCSITVVDSFIDLEQTKVEYLDSIILGEISNITIYPKDKDGNEISAEKIFEHIKIKCLFNNNSLEIFSHVNQENNTIEVYNKENITSPGIIIWQIIFDNNIVNYSVSITTEAIISNLKLNIYSDLMNQEIKENNTNITLDVKSDFMITYELVDLYYNQLTKIDSAEISEVEMYGNDMTPIIFNISREENTFNLSIPEKNKKDFNYLVSGENYELKIEVKKNDIKEYFIFPIILVSSENDTEYGNGEYNISHFTFEPNINKHEIYAGEKYIFYLNVRTQKDLLYHKELDIKEHLKFNQTFEDETFIFNASNIESKLGIYLIELYSTKPSKNDIELILKFDDEIIEKNLTISIQASHLPNPNNTEIIYYTKEINEDIQPIEIYLKIKDNYMNVISRKDIEYKKELFIMNGDEKPEQNIDLNIDNDTYILNFVSDYHNSSFNLSVYFNNSNDLILLKKEIIVQLKVKQFLEPEPLIVKIPYKPGISLIYENIKLLNLNIGIDDENENAKNIAQDMMSNADFLLYIRDKNYEKTDNDTKIAIYTGYLAIIKLININTTSNEEKYYIYDKKLIQVYENIKNKSNSNSFITLNETFNDSCGFIKLDFYENGDIKKIFYPKSNNFIFKSIEYLNETAALIIPKISSILYSEDIQSQFNDLQKDISEKDSINKKRNLLIRRLSELNPKKRKISKNKIKKTRFRVLQESFNETSENYVEDEIIPRERELDLKLREIKDNGDNTKNITLLSLEDVYSDNAKLTGSLDNKTVLTSLNEEGRVSSIYQKQNTYLESGIRDKELDEYVSNQTYNEDSFFDKDDITLDNETDVISESNQIQIKTLDSENSNSVNLVDDFTDDNGTLIEYFKSYDYEEYNDTVYQNYLLEEMGPNYLERINGSNLSISITDQYEVDDNSLRHLASSDYPYYSQKVLSTQKDIYEKQFLGLTMKTYTLTQVYPHNGQTVVETINIFGSSKKVFQSQTTYTNNHIIIKNRNEMSFQLCLFIDELKTKINNYNNMLTKKIYSNFHSILEQKKPYSYDILFDDFVKELENEKSNMNELILNANNYIINSENKVIDICKNNENIIKDELSKIYNQSKATLDEYYNSCKNFNSEVFTLIKNNHDNLNTNIELELLQEISDDINYINNDIKESIAQYISDFNNKFTKKLNIEIYFSNLLDEKSTKKETYNENINSFINQFSFLNFKQIQEKNEIINKYKGTIKLREKYISNLFTNIKQKKNDLKLNEEMYTNISNLITDYLEEKIEAENQINNFRKNINPIYQNLHEFLFNFYKEFSKEVYHVINNPKIDCFAEAKKELDEIIINITNECDYFKLNLPNNDITEHKNKIKKYLDNYNQTLLNYLNLDVDKLFPNFTFSNEFYNKFNHTQNELINSFETLQKNKSLIIQYPEEIDYIFNTIESFKNDIPQIFEDINQYINNNIINFNSFKIENYNQNISSYINSNQMYLLSYINKTVNSDKYIDYDELKTFFDNLKDLPDDIIPNINYLSENYENFLFIKNDTINKFSSTFENTINKILISRNKIYNYFHDINCETDGCSNSNEISDEKNKNQFIRARLEMLISYMNLFAQKLNETYDQTDFEPLLIYDLDFKEIIDKNFTINYINEKASEHLEETMDSFYLEINKEISNIIDSYNEINYTNILIEYKDIINNDNELFFNYTQSRLELYNITVYSLIEQYKEILYKYIIGYNYSIISFDTFKNYFNNYTNNIIDKYELIKNKIEMFKGNLADKSIYDSNINTYFINNITSLINERKSNLNDLLKNNDYNYEIEIMDKNFILKDYILEQTSLNEEEHLKEINNSLSEDISKFINSISELISVFDYPIKELLKNTTNEFLIDFENGTSLSESEKNSLFNKYINEFELPNNTENRKCWNFRGFFANEIIKEDEVNYQKYLDYLNKIQIIEECEANGNDNCPYDRSELEVIEYINNTELYSNCYERKKIYGKKQSIFYSIDDFDKEKLNSINNKLMNILNELFSFENFITNYIYKRFGLNEYKIIKNETLNLENTKNEVISKVNINKDNIINEYTHFIKDLFIKKINEIKEFSISQIYNSIKNSLSIFYNMKNRLFVKYYNKKYIKTEKLYTDLINNLTMITSAFNTTLVNLYTKIEKKQYKYSPENWEVNITEKLSEHYANEFPNKFINSILDLCKKNIEKENNLSLIKQNIDTIINDTESDNEIFEIKSSIGKELSNYYLESIDKIEIDENENVEEEGNKIEEILGKLNLVVYNDEQTSILNEYKIIKENNIRKINLEYNEDDLENKMISYINEVINSTYNLSDNLNDTLNDLFEINQQNIDQKNFTDFFANIYNKSFDYYKTIYNQINENFNNLIKFAKNLSIYNNSDEIDDKFGQLMGYGLIDGLSYLDPPCKDDVCLFTIDMIKYKSEITKNLTEDKRRRLKNDLFTKEVKDVIKVLKDIKEINKTDIFTNNINITNPKRNLLSLFNVNSILLDSYIRQKKYNSKSIGLEKKDIELQLEKLKRALENFNEKIYLIATKLQEEIKAKFEGELNALENNFFYYLYKLEKILSEIEYMEIEKYLTNQMYKINFYNNKMTSSIKSLSENYLEKINILYSTHKITGSMIYNKIIDYYDSLITVINSKYKTVSESDYKKAYSFTNNQNLLKEIYNQMSKIMISTLKLETNVEKQIETESKSIFGSTEDDEDHEIKNEQFYDYSWDDEDNYNAKKDPKDKTNYMIRRKTQQDDNKVENTQTEKEKSKFARKTEECQKKMEDLHLKLETEIKLNLFDKSLSIALNFAWDYSKDIHGGWQFPITFPACPIVQIRIGFKFTVYFRIVIGLQISFSTGVDKDTEFEIKPYTEISVGAKIDGIAEGGFVRRIC